MVRVAAVFRRSDSDVRFAFACAFVWSRKSSVFSRVHIQNGSNRPSQKQTPPGFQHTDRNRNRSLWRDLPARTKTPLGEDAQRWGAMTWFWQTVSPALGQKAAPDGWSQALIHICQLPGPVNIFAAPRLTICWGFARTHRSDLLLNTVGDRRPRLALVLAVIAVESSGRADCGSARPGVG